MLRRRILASSMASVMALTSVVGVAFAADTDVTTKEGLKKYVESFNDFIKKDLDNYGTTAAEAFTDAIDHAKTIIAKSKPTAEECAAAYAMVEAMRANLVQYDATDLAALVKGYKDVYDENNILNKELEDNVYDEEAFAAFQTAWEDGDYYQTSDDLRLTTEAYTNLEDAYAELQAKKLDTVKKSDYRAVMQEYNDIIRKQSKYETWRRGKCTVDPTTSNTVFLVDKQEDFTYKTTLTKAAYVTYGQLYDVIFGASDGTKTTFTDYDFSANYAELHAQQKGQEVDRGTTALFIWWDPDCDIATAAGADTLYKYINAAYDEFAAIKESRETSNKDIVTAYEAAKDAVAIYNGWQKDNVSSGSASSVKTLLKQYQDRLAANFGSTDAIAALTELLADGDTAPTADTLSLKNNKTGVKGWINVGTKKNILGTSFITGTVGSDTVKTDEQTTDGWKAIAKGTDILQYIEVKTGSISTDPANAGLTGFKKGTATALGKAYDDAVKYMTQYISDDPDYTDTTCSDMNVWALDELNTGKMGGTISSIDGTEADGDGAEWTLIYRALKYALTDSYGDADKVYTKKEVADLMDKAYDSIEATGDASVFWEQNTDLADACESVQEWLKEADRLGKDYADDAAVSYTADYTGLAAAGKNATEVYKLLKSKKEALDKRLESYAYSYEEIRDKIGDYYKAGVDGVEITGTKEFFEAVDRCAKALSVLEATNADNEAFDEERNFNVHNRLLTKKDTITMERPNAAETELKEAYEALDAAYEAAKNAAKQEGTLVYDLNDDHVIDVLDCRELLTLTTASEPADTAKYDYNDDDVVDVKDVRLLLEKSNEQ